MIPVLKDKICANCESSQQISERLIVPKEAGGLDKASNRVNLCRKCSFSMDRLASLSSNKTEGDISINFWVSNDFQRLLDEIILKDTHHKSIGSLVRYVINKFCENPFMFNDLDLYQDSENSIKRNVRVNSNQYNIFKSHLIARKITVTDTIKALIFIYALDLKD